VIEEVSLVARRGTITGIVGPNGAGKSTLMKAIAGVITVQAGVVQLRGFDVTSKSPDRLVRDGLSYVPQVANIFPSLTVLENLEMGGYVRKRGVSEKVAVLCDLFPDLKPALKRQAKTLSGGQRTMLAMAGGLMSDPEVLLLDEPTAGLSPRFEAAVWEHVFAIRALGVAVVVVEQNTRRTLANSDWAYLLTLGRNRLEGAGRELLENKEVVRLYIGESAGGPASGSRQAEATHQSTDGRST
jgi:branched-chain amino acid transport system ATP-binding protein